MKMDLIKYYLASYFLQEESNESYETTDKKLSIIRPDWTSYNRYLPTKVKMIKGKTMIRTLGTRIHSTTEPAVRYHNRNVTKSFWIIDGLIHRDDEPAFIIILPDNKISGFVRNGFLDKIVSSKKIRLTCQEMQHDMIDEYGQFVYYFKNARCRLSSSLDCLEIHRDDERMIGYAITL